MTKKNIMINLKLKIENEKRNEKIQEQNECTFLKN